MENEMEMGGRGLVGHSGVGIVYAFVKNKK